MPIITSLLDLDFYKLTMAQVVWKLYPDVPVTYGFTNRTKKVRLAEIIDEQELRAELDHVLSLTFTPSEIFWLENLQNNGQAMFEQKFLQFLSTCMLPDYNLEVVDGTFKLEFPGKWSEAIFWETLALSIINELYYKAIVPEADRSQTIKEGKKRLFDKIEILKKHALALIAEFGTRRRFSKDWQGYVVSILLQEIPKQLLGTSNVHLARIFNLPPIGTMAHEMFMIMSGIMHDSDEEIRKSHNQTLQDWWEQYGFGLSIALTDTFGTDFFFRDMTLKQAQNWKGLRQDSGDPIEFGEKTIKFYEGLGIDPREKLIVFSDGLDVLKIVDLTEHFKGRIKTSFGWGTNLTNDLGFGALSLVVKAIMANGFGTVKLSDNLAKAMGALEDVERFKRIFGHTLTTFEKCVY